MPHIQFGLTLPSPRQLPRADYLAAIQRGLELCHRAFRLYLVYSKPSAKAPVMHAGDEAPFLVWGGEENKRRSQKSHLTQGGKPAML